MQDFIHAVATTVGIPDIWTAFWLGVLVTLWVHAVFRKGRVVTSLDGTTRAGNAALISHNDAMNNLSDIELESIKDALRRGNKIEAIKLLREHTNVGLTEAKKMVEILETDRRDPRGS
jgi:hypothetical protein